MPQHIIEAFKEAFSKIQQRVIWKFEKPLQGLSSNVMIAKWIPQQDLIGMVTEDHSDNLVLYSFMLSTFHGLSKMPILCSSL